MFEKKARPSKTGVASIPYVSSIEVV